MRYDDFSAEGLSKEKLQSMLAPAEMRALIAMALKRSETSPPWLDFAQTSLPISLMTADEQKSLVTEMLFRSPKAAFEFVSENRRYLDPAEVNEVVSNTLAPGGSELGLILSSKLRGRACLSACST